MKPVIICGGVGSKMWPESRGKSPKHFLPLVEGKSLFQIGFENLRKKFGAHEIYLQTNAQQAEIAKSQIEEIPNENIFVEPEMRNQGPATGFAAASLIKRGMGDEPFMLVQADVLREPGDKFLEMLEVVNELALSNDKYITAGFAPDRLIRGVDYLVKGELVMEKNGVKIFQVADYVDRTEEEKINQYLGTDKLLLHANHTAMTPNNLMKMFKKYRPEWSEPLENIIAGGDVATEYARMPKGGIEEVTKEVYKNGEAVVVELPFNWIDFGTWESVAKYLDSRNTNQDSRNEIKIDANNNFIRVPAGKTVATIGVENLVVIDSGDAILITTKDKTGRVGEVVDRLKEEGRVELL